jgi:hypothetical protein
LRGVLQGIVAVDGELLRRSVDTASGKSAPHELGQFPRRKAVLPV